MAVQLEGSDEEILTCTAFLAFAQQFFVMIETARQWEMIESIDIYGESLINKMWDGDLTVVPTNQKEKENGEQLNRSALEGGYGDSGISRSIGGVL